MTNRDNLEKLVTEARYLRDHLLRVEGQDSVALGQALEPFARAEDFDAVPDADVRNLVAAFQTAHDSALGHVDGYTLNEVIKGRSPHVHRASIIGSFLLTMLAVMLVGTAFFFSNWSSRATFALVEAESFVEFDHFNSVMQLVELESYFDQVDENAADSNFKPHAVYLEGLSALKWHYYSEATLPGRMIGLINESQPWVGWHARVQQRYCRSKDKTELWWTTRLYGQLLTCTVPRAEIERLKAQEARQKAIEALAAEEGIALAAAEKALDARTAEEKKLAAALAEKVSAPGPTLRDAAEAEPMDAASIFRARLTQVEERQKNTMATAGRQTPMNEYLQSIYVVENRSNLLQQQLKMIHLWVLPIIYGALGSIVYCMWRVLNPNLAPVGFLYAVMRTAFAGLAALTLSMLMVPSNILAVGAEMNRPLIYLLSFIFGYSVEAFVSTLNMLNTYLSSNLTPKPRKGASDG